MTDTPEPQVPSSRSRVLRNATWLGLAQVLVILLSFALSIVVTRYLGPSLAGTLATGSAWIGMLGFAVDLGLGTLVTRDVARDRDPRAVNRLLVNALAVRFGLSLLAFLALAGIMLGLRYSTDTVVVALILGINGIWLSTAFGTFASVIRGFERMEFDAIWSVASKALLLLGGLFVVWRHYDIHAVAWSQVMVGMLGLVYFVTVTRRFFLKPELRVVAVRIWPVLLKASIPLGMIGIVMSIYNRLDTVMLSLARDSAEVGLYNVALAFRTNMGYIPMVILSAAFPTLAAATGARTRLKGMYEQAYRVLIALGLPIAVGIALLGRYIVPAFYGREFTGAVASLAVLGWALPVYFIQQLFAYAMMATNLSFQCVAMILAGALAKALLNLVLIPQNGAMGAAWSELASESLMVAIGYMLIIRQVGGLVVGKPTLRAAVACVAMAAAVLGLDRIGAHWILVILVGVLAYMLGLVVVGGVTRDELRAVGGKIHGSKLSSASKMPERT